MIVKSTALSCCTLGHKHIMGMLETFKKQNIYWLSQVQELNKQIEEEKQRHLEALQKQSGGDNSQGSKKSWSEAEIQCMIKAVNLFPAGTKER